MRDSVIGNNKQLVELEFGGVPPQTNSHRGWRKSSPHYPPGIVFAVNKFIFWIRTDTERSPGAYRL